MKHFKYFVVIAILLLMQLNMVYATDTEISKVEISDVDPAYSSIYNVDTDVTLSNNSHSYVDEISWSTTSDNRKKVIIVLKPYFDYCYTENTTATVNGNLATTTQINEDDYLEVTYIFPEEESSSSNSGVLTHVISVLYSRNGTISPNPIRVEHSKSITVYITPNEGYEIADVLVDGDSVGAVSEYTFRRVKENHRIQARFKKIEGYVSSTDDDDLDSSEEKIFPFTDVLEDAWYFEYVNEVYNLSIFNGTSATTFSPNELMTRGMLVQVLYNIESGENDDLEDYLNIFDDVSKDDWFYKAVAWASNIGIVSGVGDGMFAPNQFISREQVCTILYNYAKVKGIDTNIESNTSIEEYGDHENVSEYATTPLIWAVQNSIIHGEKDSLTSSINLLPNDFATRAEIAAIIIRMQEVFD